MCLRAAEDDLQQARVSGNAARRPCGMFEPAVLANGAALMDPQQDREDSTEGSGESEEAAEAPAADDAASAGPYAQAALQSLLAYDSAIAQQVSEIAAEQRAVPGAYREFGVGRCACS